MSSSSEHKLISHPDRSLATHLHQVDEISGRSLATKVLGNQFFPEIDVELLRRILVYFHDFGKGMAFFQYRIILAAKRENPDLKQLNREYIAAFLQRDDIDYLARNCTKPDLKPHSILGAFVGPTTLPEDTDPLLLAILVEVIIRHHGHLKNFEDPDLRSTSGYEAVIDTQWPLVDLPGLRAIISRTRLSFSEDIKAIKKRFEYDFFEAVYDDLEQNESYTPYFQTLFLFSLLLAGDKGDMMLGENRQTGTVKLLPFKMLDLYKRLEFGLPVKTGLNALREEAYQRVADTLAVHPNQGFYAITLPTGMGKTLTAYNAAIQLQQLLHKQYAESNPNCVPRIIYCLPFTSVIDQNAEILENILQKTDLPKGLLAKHHYLSDWPSSKATDEEETIDELTYSEREYLVEGWEYTLTVTTFVQFIETIFSNRNRNLRKFHNLANAIVLLDEVQNIPAKYFLPVATALRELHEHLGTRFIFVTATQPFLMQEREVMELTDPKQHWTRQIFHTMNRIDLDLRLWLNGPESLEDQIEEFKRAVREETGHSFLFILNLVRESQQVFEALREEALEGVVYLYLSSAILPVLRKQIIERIKNRSQESSSRIVVVSTQVVEAGVDIDLDVVYRAFAPMDSINQSAGRCNRNAGSQRGSVRLFASKASAKKIYGELLLDFTEAVLREAVAEAGPVLPEAQFYALNEKYARRVRDGIAIRNPRSEAILDNMRRLQFEEVNEMVKLIAPQDARYSIFIDDPENLPTVEHQGTQINSSMVWRKMSDILASQELDRWEKKQALRLLRSALLQYVVQFPEKCLPEDWRQEAEEKSMIRLGPPEDEMPYARCYNLTTGYFQHEEISTNVTRNY